MRTVIYDKDFWVWDKRGYYYLGFDSLDLYDNEIYITKRWGESGDDYWGFFHTGYCEEVKVVWK